jgi:hypothetical protein
MTDTTLLHDDDAGGLDLAIACRLLHHYRHAIDRAGKRGVALPELPEVNWADIASRYKRLIDEHLVTSAENPLQVRALHQFAAFALLDEQLGNLFGYGPIVDDEENRAEAVRALTAIGQFINEAEINATIDRIQAGKGDAA